MPDLTSGVLLAVIVILTAILVGFSVQIFFILKDLRKNLRKIDLILTNFENISKKIDETVSSATLVSLGAKVIASLLSLIRKNGQR